MCVPPPSAEWLVLQAQHPVFEGDNVTLRCLAKEDEKAEEKSYYKNGKKLGGTNNSDSIIVYSASRDNSIYHCTASRKRFWGSRTETSDALRIQVQGNGCTRSGSGTWQGNRAGTDGCSSIRGEHRKPPVAQPWEGEGSSPPARVSRSW